MGTRGLAAMVAAAVSTLPTVIEAEPLTFEFRGRVTGKGDTPTHPDSSVQDGALFVSRVKIDSLAVDSNPHTGFAQYVVGGPLFSFVLDVGTSHFVSTILRAEVGTQHTFGGGLTASDLLPVDTGAALPIGPVYSTFMSITLSSQTGTRFDADAPLSSTGDAGDAVERRLLFTANGLAGGGPLDTVTIVGSIESIETLPFSVASEPTSLLLIATGMVLSMGSRRRR